MITMTALRDRPRTLFAALATMILIVEWAVTQSALGQRGAVVTVAVFCDLLLALPLLFILVVLRPGRRPALDAAPVLALGALAAGALLAARPEARALLRVGGALSELAFLALLVRRLREGARQLRAVDGDDLLLRVGALSDPALRLLKAELVALHYAFVGPWVRRPLRDEELSYHEKSGLGGLLLGWAC